MRTAGTAGRGDHHDPRMPRRKGGRGPGGARHGPEGGLKAGQGGIDLDDIAQACLEIDQEAERQKNKPKNLKKKAASDESKSVAGLRAEEGKDLQQMTGLDMLMEAGGGVREESSRIRLEELVRMTVDVLTSHLDQFGACVIDDFLGEKDGNEVRSRIGRHHALAAGAGGRAQLHRPAGRPAGGGEQPEGHQVGRAVHRRQQASGPTRSPGPTGWCRPAPASRT